MAHRGRYIDIGIGVMQRMKPPEDRHSVLASVHQVMQKVQEQKSRYQAEPHISYRPRGQSHADCGLKLRPKGVRRGERKRGEDNIEEPDANIAEPSPHRRKITPPSWSAEFPPCDQQQAAKDDDGS